MKTKVATAFIFAAAMFAASSAKAETYYLKSTAGTWTTYTDANIWTNAAGTAISIVSNDGDTGKAHQSDDFVVTDGRALRTYNGGTQNAYYFFCKSLQIGGGNNARSRFIFIGSQLNNCNVVLKANGALYFYGRSSGAISGVGPSCTLVIDPSTTESNPAILEPTVNSANTYCRVYTPITGSGWLNVQNYSFESSTYAAKELEFSSNNSGYTGNIFLRGKNSSNKVTLRGINANSFGGNPETFQSKGLRLSNATLRATTVAIATTVNRGLYIGAGSAIETTSALTVNGAFAFDSVSSTLTKTGTQTLKLAGGVQENAAIGIFSITDGTLDIGGSDTVEATFKGAGALKASGTGTVKFRAASTHTGALSVADTATLDLSALTSRAGTGALALASGTSLVLPSPGVSLTVGSLSAAGPVSVTFGDGSPLADGIYEILKTGVAVDAATLANLSCVNAASSGGAISFESYDGRNVYLKVGDASGGNVCLWTGGGETAMFSDVANWEGGHIPTNGGEIVVLAASGTITNDLGDAFSPLAIRFATANSSVTAIYGDKIEFQPGGSIINSPAYGADFYAEVDFGDSPIDVSCPGGQRVSFKTMATGTHTVNHTVFWGNYTITADTWVLTTPITLGTYATVTAKNVSAAVATVGNISIINTQEGSVMTVDNLTFSNNSVNYKASLVGSHQGTLIVKGTAKVSTSAQAQMNIWSGSGSCTGAICVNKFEYCNYASTDIFNFNVSDIVFGSGGLVCTLGRLYWNGKPLTWHSMADVSIGSIDYLNGNRDSNPTALKALAIDTTDWFDNTIGRTVTMTANWKCSYTCPLSAFGIGTNVYNVALDKFTGGFTASNGVTVVLKSGARPGNGAVTMKGGTTLAVASSVTTAAIGGSSTVTLEDGSTLAFNFSSTSTAPVLAFNASSTLALPASGSVAVKVTSDASISPRDFRTVENAATPYVLTSGGKFPADAVTSGNVVLAEGAPTWIERLAVNGDGNLVLYVRAPGLTLSVR